MLLYEMISGINPFKKAFMMKKSRQEVLKQITDKDVQMLPGFSTDTKNLLHGLLKRNPDERLTVDQIKAHPFFASINWEQLLAREVAPPFVPPVRSNTDVSQIDTDFTSEQPTETP